MEMQLLGVKRPQCPASAAGPAHERGRSRGSVQGSPRQLRGTSEGHAGSCGRVRLGTAFNTLCNTSAREAGTWSKTGNLPISYDTTRRGSQGCLGPGLRRSTCHHIQTHTFRWAHFHNNSLTQGLRNTRNVRNTSSGKVKVTLTHQSARVRTGQGASSAPPLRGPRHCVLAVPAEGPRGRKGQEGAEAKRSAGTRLCSGGAGARLCET